MNDLPGREERVKPRLQRLARLQRDVSPFSKSENSTVTLYSPGGQRRMNTHRCRGGQGCSEREIRSPHSSCNGALATRRRSCDYLSRTGGIDCLVRAENRTNRQTSPRAKRPKNWSKHRPSSQCTPKIQLSTGALRNH